MSGSRRYNDTEVKRIFEEAAALAGKRQQPSEGLTLAEIQDIALEVGLPAERVAAAARALDVTTPLPRRRHFGLPIGVGHAVMLSRAPNDREWEIFLAEIRRTFNGAGQDRSTSVTRHWSSGNLHVLIEPMEEGTRLRMGTMKGGATAANWLGFSWGLAGGTIVVASGVFHGAGLLAPAFPLGFLALGSGMFLSNLIRLPRWAATREEQMIALAQRAQAILASPPGGGADDQRG